jgi:hypothetical protein
VTTVLLLCAVPVSVPVTVQNPTVVVAVRVIVTWPDALVVPVNALKLVLPHVPVGLPTAPKLTTSPCTGVPPTPVVTVAVIVEVLEPSARMLDGLAETAMLFGTAV